MTSTVNFYEYAFFLEAWSLLAFARILLLFIPFKKIVPLLGKVTDKDGDPILPEYNCTVPQKISTAILRGSRYTPWRAKCFEQALAAKMMLKRRGFVSIVYFGVRKTLDNKELLAHAWLISNSVIVTGGGKIDQYTVLSSFEG